MQTSTPSNVKKRGRLGKSDLPDVVSPIESMETPSSNTGYSKRERKPKKWDGYETDDTTESRHENKETVKDVETFTDNEKDSGNKCGILSDSVEILIEEQGSPVSLPTISAGKRGSGKPKGKQRGRGRRMKTKTEDLESTDLLHLDVGLHSENKISGKKKTSIPANTFNDICNTVNSDSLDVNGCKDKTQENAKTVIETIVTDGGDLSNSDERLIANPEEIKSLKGAVENKRTTKYIEKCDRVMIRTVSAYGEHEMGACGMVSKINVSDSVKSHGNIAKTDQVITPKKTPGRRKGRQRKSSIEADYSSIQYSTLSVDNRNESITESGLTVDPSIDTLDNFKTPVRRRGRPPKITMENDEHDLKHTNPSRNSSSGRSRAKKVLDNKLNDVDDSVKIESVTESGFAVGSSLDTSNSLKTHVRRRGRTPKNAKEKNENSLENPSESPGSTRRGRKRKEVNYAALDGGILVGDAGVKEDGSKRQRIEKEQPSDDDGINLTDKDEVGTERGSIPRRRRTPKQETIIKCLHCDYEASAELNIRRHCAVNHQVWWTKECPEGESDKQALTKIIKIKKFLNCTKCNKQINFITYYPNHIEWCGLEHLTYSCEHCKKDGLMLRWQHVHMKTCPALMAQFRAEIKEEKQLEVEKYKDDETITTGRRKQRKAAKKAMSIVHNISKDMDPSAYSDQSDNDPDVVIRNDDDAGDEDDDDDDDDIEISEDESIGIPDEDDGDVVNFDSVAKGMSIGGPFRDFRFASAFNPFPLMEEFMRENWSDELFMDWLPRKRDWKQLSQSESEPYLPAQTPSIRFSFRRKDVPRTLETYCSQNVAGSPLFHCGLVVWQLTWCPVPFGCSDEQVLAITGKVSDSEAFVTDERLSSPGIIQIWNTEIESNIVNAKAVPKLCYNVVHDFGLATQMSWCPSGCYKSSEEQVDASVHTRLGLLAVSFTDGTCRVFSLPFLSVSDVEEAPTYRATPVLTLIPYLGYEMDEITCSCVDWIQAKGHTKVLVGYSNGNVSVGNIFITQSLSTELVCASSSKPHVGFSPNLTGSIGAVRLFNLVSTSPLQRLVTSDGPTLLPYRNLQPHGNLVRAARWCSDLENIIVTSSESFDTTFWDINNTGEALHEDGGYMTMSIASTVLQHGVYVTADENYAILYNKGRYIDGGNLIYLNRTAQRKDERASYYITSQPACIWDVSCSNWHTLVAACDNRGAMYAYIVRDLMKVIPDNKSYKYRQVLLKTRIREDKVDKNNKTTENNSDSTHCQKCSSNQSGDSLHSSENQSETTLKCTCNETDQSNCTNNMTNKKRTNDQSERSEVDHVTAHRQTCMTETKKVKDYHVLVDKSVLHFEEYHNVTKYHPHDKDSDRYDRPSIAAIKSVSLNPNRLQCCWLAYGGNSGLVRLVNVQNILHTSAHKYLKEHRYI